MIATVVAKPDVIAVLFSVDVRNGSTCLLEFWTDRDLVTIISVTGTLGKQLTKVGTEDVVLLPYAFPANPRVCFRVQTVARIASSVDLKAFSPASLTCKPFRGMCGRS